MDCTGKALNPWLDFHTKRNWKILQTVNAKEIREHNCRSWNQAESEENKDGVKMEIEQIDENEENDSEENGENLGESSPETEEPPQDSPENVAVENGESPTYVEGEPFTMAL